MARRKMALGEEVVVILGSHWFHPTFRNRIRSRRFERRSHLLNSRCRKRRSNVAPWRLWRSWISNRGDHRSQAQHSTSCCAAQWNIARPPRAGFLCWRVEPQRRCAETL